MSNIQFSHKAKSMLLANIELVKQPTATSGGSSLTDQDLCHAFGAAGAAGKTVKLISFTATDNPTNRQRTVTTNSGDKITSVRSDSMQQTGVGRISVNVGGVDTEYVVKMHSPVALAFTQGDEQILVGSTGEISSGANAGKLWLSLRLPTEPTTAQLTEWLTAKEVVEIGAL